MFLGKQSLTYQKPFAVEFGRFNVFAPIIPKVWERSEVTLGYSPHYELRYYLLLVSTVSILLIKYLVDVPILVSVSCFYKITETAYDLKFICYKMQSTAARRSVVFKHVLIKFGY